MIRNILRGAVASLVAACALVLSLGAPGAAHAQNVPNYADQGGATWHVKGTLAVESGGAITAPGKAAVTANTGNSYAVTANQAAIAVTTDSLSTAAGSSQTITISDSQVTASSLIFVSRNGGTNTGGTPSIKAVPSSGAITVTIDNKHASAAFNGTFVLSLLAIG
jgi:hypothetical protein